MGKRMVAVLIPYEEEEYSYTHIAKALTRLLTDSKNIHAFAIIPVGAPKQTIGAISGIVDTFNGRISKGQFTAGYSEKLDKKDVADTIVKQLYEKYDWREGGQNNFEVFEMPELNIIHSDYSEIKL